jgi:hypothetical protein
MTELIGYNTALALVGACYLAFQAAMWVRSFICAKQVC